jgi:hypothetical protein
VVLFDAVQMGLAVHCCDVMLQHHAARGLEDYDNDHVDVAVCCEWSRSCTGSTPDCRNTQKWTLISLGCACEAMVLLMLLGVVFSNN